jgi:hypothetical protein
MTRDFVRGGVWGTGGYALDRSHFRESVTIP